MVLNHETRNSKYAVIVYLFNVTSDDIKVIRSY